jgi:TAT (twin-arginine translocation) pathway signal sequence
MKWPLSPPGMEATMDRRSFLVGSGVAAAGIAAGPVSAQYVDDAWLKGPAKRPLAPGDIESAVQRLRKQFLAEFDPAYVENVIVPHFLVSVYDGERPYLPMIGVELTKENALPFDLWGLLSETWKPAPEKGVTLPARVGEARPA